MCNVPAVEYIHSLQYMHVGTNTWRSSASSSFFGDVLLVDALCRGSEEHGLLVPARRGGLGGGRSCGGGGGCETDHCSE